MCCQLTWWRALGITAQQRPASKKVRTERATPCSSSDMGHGDLQIQFNFFLSGFLCGHENKGTFPESSLLMPPLPVLRFTLWYPTYIRKRPWKGRKKKKAGSTQRVTAIYWQTHAIAQTTKHSYYSTFLRKAGGKPVWKHYESRQVPTVTAVRWGYLATTRVCTDNPPRRYFFQISNCLSRNHKYFKT